MLRLFRGLFLRVQTELLISIAIRPQGWNMAEGGPHHHIYIYIYTSHSYTQSIAASILIIHIWMSTVVS